MPDIHCPICDTVFSTDLPAAELPFCSMRCKQIDAANWLGEEYGLPIESDDRAERMTVNDTDE
ncbi:MAG: DNA gyrase inhibitor YacG [Planctomycetaceae bacterium]|jgi:endogenous inhibitor of DNA gyrase (YacG/DUF329 family)|nr:DNA gyrase inhibitor YacG [Planctomycetaceae bacterium]